MKVVGFLFVFGFAGVFASEQVWIDLMSAQIVEAVGKDVEADRNIPQLATDLGLKKLVDYVTQAGLAGALSGTGPFTVFGPTDAAFDKVPEFLLKNNTILAKILQYHVASGNVSSGELRNDLLVPSLLGSAIRINIYKVKDNTVVTASGREVDLTKVDQEASNGVIHEVKGVLFPPAGTITAVVKKCPAFSTLLTAVGKVPDIVTALDGPGPFTLFAPSDKAFDKIPEKCLKALLNDIPMLTKVLQYHVVPSTAYSAGLSCGDEAKTLEGSSVKVRKWKGRVYINCSLVTYADATTTNGVIHVIDRVLFPKDAANFCDGVDLRNDVTTC